MKVGILGGTGLISQAIARELAKRGDQVWVFNRGLSVVELPHEVRSMLGNRSSPDDLRAFASKGFDAVIDMICFTEDDAKVAIAAFSGRVEHYVLCSTIDVYTKPAIYYPVDEMHERCPNAAFTYAYQKQMAEESFEQAAVNGAFALTVLRPGATYAAHVVAPLGTMDLCVERLRQGKPVVLPGDGTSIWTACHRDDVARGFVAAVNTARARGRAYNLVSSELMTWQTYWATYAEAIGINEPSFLHIPTSALVRIAPRAAAWCEYNFQHHHIVDSSAAARDLGFASTVPWREGARRVAAEHVPQEVDPSAALQYDEIVAAWSNGLQTALSEYVEP